MRIKIKTGIYGHRQSANRLRLFVFVDGQSIVEGLIHRYDKPYEFYREEILPRVLKRLGLEDVIGRATWSQKCGCSCGCSPGFWLTVNESAKLDYDTIYATVNRA